MSVELLLILGNEGGERGMSVQSAPRRHRAASSFLFSSPLRSSSSSCEKAERRQPHNHESLHARVLITFPQIKCDKSPCALAGCTPEVHPKTARFTSALESGWDARSCSGGAQAVPALGSIKLSKPLILSQHLSKREYLFARV